MGESNHTPGPWQAGLNLPLVSNNNPDPRIVWASSLQVADCRTPWISAGEAEANAKLVAATPELLAACKLWEEGFVDGEKFNQSQLLAWVNKNRAAARAAIAKATN